MGAGAAEAAAAWPSLTTLTCSANSFHFMDSSLALLPAVERLNLSGNNIATVQNLTACASLTQLDLSSNCIASLAQVGLCAGPLRRLVLQVRSLAPAHQICTTELYLS